MSPTLNSPLTVPLTGICWPASVALITSSSVMLASNVMARSTGAVVSTPYPSLSVAVALLPAASVLVTLASIVRSVSAARSLPATRMVKRPSAVTGPVNDLPLTVRVTVSPSLNSPLTVPLTGISCWASAALITSSAVISESKRIASSDTSRSTSYPSLSVAVVLLPAASVLVTLASMVRSESAAKSLPATRMVKRPSPVTGPVKVLPLTVSVTMSPALNSPFTVPLTGMF